MCGRFDQHDAPYTYAQGLDAQIRTVGEEPPSRYNVAPQTSVWIGRASAEHREMVPLRWGLVPFWAADPGKGPQPINARAETVLAKASFRKLVGWRRCVVPVSGFYEWKHGPAGKVPYYIRLAENRPMYLAALWDRWQQGAAAPLESFTLITTEPNELTAQFYDRMPVIIREQDIERWLDSRRAAPEDVIDLLRPLAAEDLIAYPVSRRVNSSKNEGAELIERVPWDDGDLLSSA